MWNPKIKERILDKYNLICHKLKNQKIIFDGQTYTILNVYKRWNEGWYLSIEINYDENHYVELPFKNINSENTEIIEKINCTQSRTQGV